MKIKSIIKSAFFVPKHKPLYDAKQKTSETLDFEVILSHIRIFI